MPIIQPNTKVTTFFYPESNYHIAKYIDLTKFISLLQRRALFFCRADKLEDKFEGAAALKNYNVKVNMYKSLRNLNIDITDEKIIENVESDLLFAKRHKSIVSVSCWNKFSAESAALWKIYSDYNKGIMIKSSINQIIKSLEKQPQDIQLSEVRYINYEEDVMLEHVNYPFFYKQKAYSYENEVRMLYQVTGTGKNWDWADEEVEEGLFMNVDLDVLIDEIILSPDSPQWFYKLIEDLLKRYKVKKNISYSILA